MIHVTDFPHGIAAIDSGFGRERLCAIHLVVENGRAAIIDTGTNHSVPRVLAVLAARGIDRAQVDWVILTHIHLDHAGGAGQFMQAFPNARLTVHPRGARHVADPARLVEGTIAVYGAEKTRSTYGDIVPVPRDRIVETPHGATIDLGGRTLVFLDTPGHARHHVSVWDERSRRVFAGDTFGFAYVELDDADRRYIFLTTSPTQFDPDAEHRSLDLITGLRPEGIFLTHYAEVRDIARMADDLHRLTESHRALGMRLRDAGPERHARLRDGVTGLILDEAARYGWRHDRAALERIFEIDIELNAQGLACWLDATAAAGANGAPA
jgi:hydroxyacylglutathione hydrolase